MRSLALPQYIARLCPRPHARCHLSDLELKRRGLRAPEEAILDEQHVRLF